MPVVVPGWCGVFFPPLWNLSSSSWMKRIASLGAWRAAEAPGGGGGQARTRRDAFIRATWHFVTFSGRQFLTRRARPVLPPRVPALFCVCLVANSGALMTRTRRARLQLADRC